MKQQEQKDIMISHSSMEVMEQCLYKWYLKYIKKLKVNVPKNIESDLGSCIHEIIEKFESGDSNDFKKLAKEIVKKYSIDDSLKKKVPIALKNFWKFWNDELKELNLTKDNKEKKLFANTHEENFKMMAVLDLIFKNENGKITVIDWKTNKKPRDATKQLAFYFYFLKMIDFIPENQNECEFKIVYLCLDATDNIFIVPYKLTILDLETASNRIQSFINKVKIKGMDETKYRKKPGPLCPWCDYYKAGVCKGQEELTSTNNQL